MVPASDGPRERPRGERRRHRRPRSRDACRDPRRHGKVRRLRRRSRLGEVRVRVPVRTRRPSLPNRPVLAVRRLTSRAPARSDSLFRSTSHCISIHDAVSAEPWDVPGALRAFSCGGTSADCAMLDLGVLYPAFASTSSSPASTAAIISGFTSSTPAQSPARARAPCASTPSASPSVSVPTVVPRVARPARRSRRRTAPPEIADAPALAARSEVACSPSTSRRFRAEISEDQLTRPGVSCTQCDWVRVAGEVARAVTGADADFPDGVSELPIPADGALDEDAKWVKGKRWFRNKPGPARDDRREGFDKRAVGDRVHLRVGPRRRVRRDFPHWESPPPRASPPRRTRGGWFARSRTPAAPRARARERRVE